MNMYNIDFFLPGTMLCIYVDPGHLPSAKLNPTFHGQVQEDRTVNTATLRKKRELCKNKPTRGLLGQMSEKKKQSSL